MCLDVLYWGGRKNTDRPKSDYEVAYKVVRSTGFLNESISYKPLFQGLHLNWVKGKRYKDRRRKPIPHTDGGYPTGFHFLVSFEQASRFMDRHSMSLNSSFRIVRCRVWNVVAEGEQSMCHSLVAREFEIEGEVYCGGTGPRSD